MKAVGVIAVAMVLALSWSSQAFAKHHHHHHHHGMTMSHTGPSGPGLEPGATDKSRPGGKGVSNKPGD
jgi:hypothetical protein